MTGLAARPTTRGASRKQAMQSTKRIYEVTNKQTGVTRLVTAQNPAQATRHVIADTLEVKAASAVRVGSLMSSGVQLENTPAQESQA